MVAKQHNVIAASPPSRSSTGSIRRISSIKEESAITSPKLSPTLSGAFDSPLTASTESTESVKTIKGSAAPTPAASALRTPSYPFPYVPGTPRTWSAAYHKPFMTLSPTVSAGTREGDTSTDGLSSGLNTPVASASMFVPPGITGNEESPDFPVPNLYDLTLMLSLDPGMDAWWSTVARIFQESFAAERISLALPADAGELTNVPWGQKATFNVTGAPAVNHRIESPDRDISISHSPRALYSSMKLNLAQKLDSEQSRKLGLANQRPSLAARHSYAGAIREQDFRTRQDSAYEEYEQFPSSPWSQSPAPSPAIQTDSDTNPFFCEPNVDEASFAPPEKTVDYTNSGVVEAIGVDKASTVIHLPLIHPRVASNLPFRTGPPGAASPFDRLTTDRVNEGRASPLKRAPIAVLSFSAPVVPYPQQLVQTLQLLAPHLATTFEIAQLYTSATAQKDALQRRTREYSISDTPHSLDDLADAEVDLSNDSTSLTSPSDYSGRSRQSPGGSIGAMTPGNWEQGSLSFGPHGVPSTPGHEMVESYFDPKKRAPSSVSQSLFKAPESPGPENEFLSRMDRKTREERHTPPKTSHRAVHDTAQRKPHSLLHSYGADFRSTFQTLPQAATPNIQTPGVRLPDPSRVSTVSVNDTVPEMPPPSERLLRTIVDALPVQIFTAAPQTGHITWVNSKFIVYRGQAAQAVLSHPWNAIHDEDRPAYMEEWQRSLNTGQQFSHKVRLRRFDNAYRWFYVRATPLKDRNQRTVHWAGTYMDIHEQHTAEAHAAHQQETAASEAKYRALANSSPQIVFAVSRAGGLSFCNSQWISYSGQTEPEAMGVGFMDFVHPEDLAKCRLPTLNEDGTVEVDAPTSLPPETTPISKGGQRDISDTSSESSKTVTSPGVDSSEEIHMPQSRLYKLASTGILKVARDQDGRPSYTTEVRLRSKDNQYRWHLIRVLLSDPTRKDEIDEETWYGTCTDINDHKILEQKLKDTMDAKSRFLSNMSHEIRTPLNGITGMVNFLIDSSLTTEQMEHVNIIRNSTEGLRDLINDILDLSKVEAGMITLTMDWMHVRSLIEEVNDIMFALAMDKELELNYIVAEDVPSLLKGDRFRVRQVLLNVIGNAIKFTTHGEVFIRCEAMKSRAGLEDNEVMIRFEVMDTGSGFTEKEAEFLFKRFSQIGSATQTGTGLGLAISMQLVELHGGKMTANSVPNKGSTFTFTIKCTTSSDAERPKMTAVSSADSVELAAAAVLPTPQPITETSQGVRFANNKPLTKFSPTQTPSPRIHHSSAASSGSSDPSLHTADTIVKHIDLTIPKSAPHHITTRRSVVESASLLTGDDAVRFSHIVVDLPEAQQALEVLHQILTSPAHANTCVVIIADVRQRRALSSASHHNFDKLEAERRLRFIFKPLKPSKMAVVFDPQKESEVSSDMARTQNSAQAVAITQKMIFDELSKRLGNKGLRVLLVEDNKTSQMVLLRFLKRVSITVECVQDGLQCTEKVLSQPHGYYSLILCDLHMPIKDGYQTTKDIRHWERQNQYPYMPIVALSANVLGDVYAKCAEAGFNSYVTKPVDFKELRDALVKFLDPPEAERAKGPVFMRVKH
ncbi:hypothetical protein BT63DRAFT_379101 [Microthyrium microscopicum]|uniref:histidine kinase n=1 Tax=Microthyrium microscopicum TaxID=703497 RepID=A0A6A6U113_9PEZI|nr:hypothetical protein BT63DRAFT_379101 [Microthyrium microscopicum]